MNLTLTDIPDAVYRRLKAAAEAHRRSLESEAIACLETVLLPGRGKVEERLERARDFRSRFSHGPFLASDIETFKREGAG